MTIASFNVGNDAFQYQDYEYFQWFKAKTPDNLKLIIKWKKLHRINLFDYCKIERDSRRAILDSSINSLITIVFINHLNEPLENPLLDRFVWQAMKKLDNDIANRTNKNPSNINKDYYNGYKTFFGKQYESCKNRIQYTQIPSIRDELIKRRVLDRALWEYGRKSVGLSEREK